MTIRMGTPKDLSAISRLYREARASLKAMGVDQWQEGDYPGEQDALMDMAAGRCYVLEEDGAVLAVACLAFGREPTYEVIEQGAWAADPREYGFLHRIAVAPEAKGRGAAGQMFAELERQAQERGVTVLRGDTHRDNLPMQRVMAKSGLQYRGIIRLEDGSLRLAFEKLLPTP